MEDLPIWRAGAVGWMAVVKKSTPTSLYSVPSDGMKHTGSYVFKIPVGLIPERYDCDYLHDLDYMSLNGLHTSDDFQWRHPNVLMYKSRRGHTDTLFDYRDGPHYQNKWFALHDEDGVNGYKPAWVNWRYYPEKDEFNVVVSKYRYDLQPPPHGDE
eukprot:GHVN01076363.1.p1 GENE.GHVN01076363.1~~GHVN01076363.1.p1  ORF type:complete len:156 (+),score=24.94 GHVN01076363.1:159-626(+)